jgi:hypothetical protein
MTDPLAADALWRPLDRRLSDLAVLVCTVTPSEVDVVSKRTRNCECNPVWGAASISCQSAETWRADQPRADG